MTDYMALQCSSMKEITLPFTQRNKKKQQKQKKRTSDQQYLIHQRHVIQRNNNNNNNNIIGIVTTGKLGFFLLTNRLRLHKQPKVSEIDS